MKFVCGESPPLRKVLAEPIFRRKISNGDYTTGAVRQSLRQQQAVCRQSDR